jgi:nicotinamide phosphoribosyltransferase
MSTRHFNDNLILLTDSYKASHWVQYPEDTETVFSYLESRGGMFDELVAYGFQYFIKRYLSGKAVSMADINFAEDFCKQHGVSFNRNGWEYIVNVHGGKLPVSIKAIPEGTVVPTKNVLMTIENTDPKCYWLTNYLETLLLQVWYPITVATLSREMKKHILNSLK